MRLLYFTRAYTVHDHRFLQAFRSHAVEVGYLALRDAAESISRLSIPAGVKVLGHLGMPDDPSGAQLDAAVAAFERISSRFSPDLVLAGPLSDCGYIAANAKLSYPWVAQSWAFDVFWESQQSSDAAQRTRVALHGCPALFADCEAVVAQCEKIAGQSMPSRFIMPWGIDLADIRQPRHREALRRELGVEGRKVFLHTRGLEPVYGVETLLNAFRLVYQDDPATLLLLASDGSLRPEVERFVTRHSLPAAVRLLGSLPHAHALDLFTAADGYVSCAASDGTSVSLLEAMALGLLPVVPNAGGNAEWICDEGNGWVVPLGDVARLRAAMAAAVNLDPSNRDRLAVRNRESVEARADWAANFPSFLDFLVNRTHRGGPVSVLGN
jgi:glycosyltransferase involved in cell wall biosynthesis